MHECTVTCSPSPGYPGLRQNRCFCEGSRWQTVSRALRSRQGVEVQSSRSSQAAEGARFTDLLSLFFADDSILVSSSADLQLVAGSLLSGNRLRRRRLSAGKGWFLGQR